MQSGKFESPNLIPSCSNGQLLSTCNITHRKMFISKETELYLWCYKFSKKRLNQNNRGSVLILKLPHICLNFFIYIYRSSKHHFSFFFFWAATQKSLKLKRSIKSWRLSLVIYSPLWQPNTIVSNLAYPWMELCDKEIHLLNPIFEYNTFRTTSNFKFKHTHVNYFHFSMCCNSLLI